MSKYKRSRWSRIKVWIHNCYVGWHAVHTRAGRRGCENWIKYNIKSRNVWLKQQVWIYTEDDWIAEVKILEDISDERGLGYKLKVIKSIQQTKFYKPVKDGYEFQCFCLKEGVKYPMPVIKQETSFWTLEWKEKEIKE